MFAIHRIAKVGVEQSEHLQSRFYEAKNRFQKPLISEFSRKPSNKHTQAADEYNRDGNDAVTVAHRGAAGLQLEALYSQSLIFGRHII
jgi:hypothetical protein